MEQKPKKNVSEDVLYDRYLEDALESAAVARGDISGDRHKILC